MTLSKFPNTSGDVILDLKDHDDGSVSLAVVDSTGALKDAAFGTLMTVVNGGGHVEAHTKVIADNLGFIRDSNQLFAPVPG